MVDYTGTTAITCKGIPTSLFKKFKSQCALDGLTMREGIIKALIEFVKENKK